MTRRTIVEIFAGVFIFFMVAGYGVVRYTTGLEAAATARDQIISAKLAGQQEQLDENKLAIDILVNESRSAQKQIAEETAKRMAVEAARQADAARAATQIASLESRSAQQIKELQKNIDQNKVTDLSSIISSWRPRVALITCKWQFSNGTATGTGSGVLFSSTAGGAKLITNGHVVSYKGSLPNQCTIKFPDEPISYMISPGAITLASTGIDAAFIEMANPSPYLKGLASGSAARCVAPPSIGESIVILGYPSIGSTTGITATEGILSGNDGDYFITSAKVERGNSGGAAILSKSNCYLGIPSFVDVGQIEALARILDQTVIGG